MKQDVQQFCKDNDMPAVKQDTEEFKKCYFNCGDTELEKNTCMNTKEEQTQGDAKEEKWGIVGTWPVPSGWYTKIYKEGIPIGLPIAEVYGKTKKQSKEMAEFIISLRDQENR